MTSEVKGFESIEFLTTTTEGNCSDTTYPIDYESLDFDLYQRYEKNRAVPESVSFRNF
jgi:hypothetical protein